MIIFLKIIGYEIYHPMNKSKLDLSYCKEESIRLNIPVSIDEKNLFKYDPNSGYYTDNCFSYTSENGTDIILSDRRQEFTDKNLSLCENKCNFTGYNEEIKQSSCACIIKNKMILISEIIDNPNKLSNNLDSNIDSEPKIITMKCTKVLFSKDGLKNNISSYVLLFIIIFYLFSIIIFIKCGYPFLKNDINLILKDKEKEENNKKKTKNSIITRNSSKTQNNKNNIKRHTKTKKNRSSFKTTQNNPKLYSLNMNSNTNVSLRRNNLLNLGNERERKNKKKNKQKSNQKAKKFFNTYEMNSFEYSHALIYDKRKFCEYYISLLRTKHPILFAFCPIKEYNSKIIKLCLFLLTFAVNYAINFAFFSEEIIHKIFEENGKYDIEYFLPQITISIGLTYVINIILKIVFLSERNILKIKKKVTLESADLVSDSVKKTLAIKYIIFYILSILFLSFFWMLLSSFGAVYQNTQIFVFKNALIGFSLSLVYPFFINIIPCIFRTSSLSNKSNCNENMYNLSKFFQILL